MRWAIDSLTGATTLGSDDSTFISTLSRRALVTSLVSQIWLDPGLAWTFGQAIGIKSVVQGILHLLRYSALS